MASVYYTFALLALACFFTVTAERVELDWSITYVNGTRDGYNERRSIGVNGQLPIPPVYVNQGDTLLLHVHNALDKPTSLHAHGIFHNGTVFEDGAGGVTECGIPPGGRHTYTIQANQVGTFWIHGHNLYQNIDGLRTPFIIREQHPPAQYDEEVLFTLEDWYPLDSGGKLEELVQPDDQSPASSTFPYGLINGYNGNDTKPVRFVPGKRYRFRVVSMSVTEWWKFSIPGHKLEVIEVEGGYPKPYEVDGLDIGPGQRYSAIVTAKNSDEFNFYYNATLYADFVPWIPGMNPRYYKGLIEYQKGAPVKEAPRQSDQDLVWANDIAMQNVDDEPALPVDRQIELTAKQFITTEGSNLRTVNVYSYSAPLVPSLFTALTEVELSGNRDIYGPQAEVQVLDHLEAIELLINNPTDTDHSFHLHGHNFQVVERGPVRRSLLTVIPDSTHLNQPFPKIPVRKSLTAPIRRDTVVIPVFSYVKIRFRADNPGVWLFHCHMDTHHALGMAITFVEAPDVLQQRQPHIPKELQDMCLAQGRKISGNAAGNSGFDFTGLPDVPGRAANQTNAMMPFGQ